MIHGWIKSYQKENQAVGSRNPYHRRIKRAEFRQAFQTSFYTSKSEQSAVLENLSWGQQVELPNGLSKSKWTKVEHQNQAGYILTRHLVEIAYVKRKKSGRKQFVADLEYYNGEKIELLWGDLVQITKAGSTTCEVRARGNNGKMKVADLDSQPLLETYFIDVAQGDGVLVVTPDRRHLLIDGGLERKSQQTGKNAADFLDWKFFFDYGAYQIELDSMMASHSDTDHFGGLHDLVRMSEMADRELDCVGVSIKTFHHPGLSRWSRKIHYDGMGRKEQNHFVQLIDDRNSAEQAVDSDAPAKLSGPWRSFIKAILKNEQHTKFERLGVEVEELQQGSALPHLWPSKQGCSIRVLGPVSKQVNGKPGLPDLGDTGKNSNGHSICLRIDYGHARILMTGDLNKRSMQWISDSYGDRMGAWACDVAKACHHGSNDISYRFLEEIKAAATIISSGDAEGHAHPRPDVVGASAMTGFVSIDRNTDKLITPLIYMTEVERSVSLGSLNRIDLENFPGESDNFAGAVPTKFIDEFGPRDFLSPQQRKEYERLEETDKKAAQDFLRRVRNEQKPLLEALEEDVQKNRVKVDFNLSIPRIPFGTRNVKKRAWKSRIMERNHYGLVNVRTDGETIMCATKNETGKRWIIHTFPARF